jgi:DNA polymerase I-like protein with 3'-5' exonuclease and polymerase domains
MIVKYVNKNEDLYLLEEILRNAYEDLYVSLDTETTGLDPNIAKPLLMSVASTLDYKLVLNLIKIDKTLLKKLFDSYKHLIFICHNATYDWAILYKNYGIEMRVVCTMVGDLKISQGLGFDPENNPSGYRYDLNSVAKRRVGADAIDKEERMSFVDFKGTEFKESQINYAAADVEHLYGIFKVQQSIAEEEGILLWYVEHEILSEVAKAECTGIKIDKELWKQNALEIYNQIYEVACKIDNILREKGLRVNNRHYIPLQGNADLFNTSDWVEKFYGGKRKINPLSLLNKNKINYGSTAKIVKIFGLLNYPMPIKDQDIYLVPRLTDDGTKLVNKYAGYTASKTKLEVMVKQIDHPNEELVNLIIKYSSLKTLFSTFGGRWLDKLYEGRIYTKYRTMNAVTGRFQSGGGKRLSSKINIQNIPSRYNFRKSFIADDGYSLVTADLSGAEVIILADKANDLEVYERAVIQDDSHSPVAEKVWRLIYLYRAGVALKVWHDAEEFQEKYDLVQILKYIRQNATGEAKENLEKYYHFEISKKVNKNLRDEFKKNTFGGIYGMKFRKAAESLNVNWEEAKVALFGMRLMMERCYEFVEKQVNYARYNGFITLNKFGSKVYFPETLNMLSKGLSAKDSMDASKEVESARNYPIQGTQADMIKLSIYLISRLIVESGLKAQFLIQVHDELVYQVPKPYDGVSQEWLDNKEANCVDFDIQYDRAASLESAIKFCHAHEDHVVDIIDKGEGWVNYKISHSLAIPIMMIYAADKFLEKFTMSTSLEVKDYWQK